MCVISTADFMTAPSMPSEMMLAYIRSAHIVAPILLGITTKESPGFVYAYDENNISQRVLLAFGDNSGEKFWKRCLVVNDKLWRTFPDTSPLSYESRDPHKPAYGQPLEIPCIGQWGGAAFMGDGVFGGISGLTEAEDESGALAITAHPRGNWEFPHLTLRDEVAKLLRQIRRLIPTT